MKQTLEVDVPEGYEIREQKQGVEHQTSDPFIMVYLKKQTVKDFDYFVEQYLSDECGATVAQLRNWISNSDLNAARINLTRRDFKMVPWEMKIGLFKFICDDGKVDWIFQYEIYRASGICDGFPKEFLNNLFETK